MKLLKVEPGPIKTKVIVPSSKSYANRALILAAAKKKSFTINNLPESSDVTFLASGLSSLGLNLLRLGDSITIKNSFPECESSSKRIEIGEGGTTGRFLACLILRGSHKYELILGDRLKSRPWDEFISFVRSHGGHADLNDQTLSIQGPLKLPSEVTIDCSRTTQFASGIQLAFPETKVRPTNLRSSISYWEMTLEQMSQISQLDSYDVPLDWSSASYPLAFSALNQETHFPGLHRDPFQADSKMCDLLKSFKCLEESPEGMRVKKTSVVQDVSLDIRDCLDLAPTLAYFLAHIPGVHKLSGTENLNLKESLRLDEILKILKVFSREASSIENDLIIHGSEQKIHEKIDLRLPDDHRIVMMGSLFLRHHSGGTVSPADAVQKSYPEFFRSFL